VGDIVPELAEENREDARDARRGGRNARPRRRREVEAWQIVGDHDHVSCEVPHDQVPNAQVAARTMDEQQTLPRAVNLVVDDQLPRVSWPTFAGRVVATGLRAFYRSHRTRTPSGLRRGLPGEPGQGLEVDYEP
jgi:hypothetical protein